MFFFFKSKKKLMQIVTKNGDIAYQKKLIKWNKQIHTMQRYVRKYLNN